MIAPTNINVLLIEEDVDDIQLVIDLLSGQASSTYLFTKIHTYDDAIKMISSNSMINFDVVLLDYYLEQDKSSKLMQEFSNRKLSIPVILLTDTEDATADLEAMQLGAADFIVKNAYCGFLLDRSIRYAIEHKKNQRLLIKQQQKEAAMLRASALAEMATFVTHEINNPLGAIQGYASAIELTLQKEFIDRNKVKEQVDKILSMVNRISDIKKSLRNNYAQLLRPTHNPLDIAPIIQEAIQLCKEPLSKVGANIFFDYKRTLMVRCQSIELSQVFVNLITNSCEAIQNLKDRWITIQIQEHRDRIQILITDSGTGISPDVLEKLFSKYFTTKNEGSGIGLHLSKNIIESYGGQLSYNKTTDHTQFVIDLPLSKADEQKQHRYRFLVVDDEADFAQLIGEGISAQGFDVEIETSPLEALKKINHADFDAVITDVHMYELNGMEFALKFRKFAKHMPIFSFISGYINSSIKGLIEDKKLGCIYEKPLNINDLIASTVQAIKSVQKN